MSEADSTKSVSSDISDSVTNPPSQPSAPKGGHPTRKLKPRKPRPPEKILSTALHFERKQLADIESSYNNARFRSLAFINFVTVFQVSRHLSALKTNQQLSVLFNDMYQPGQLISLQQINSLDDSKLEWDAPRDDKPPRGINYDLFPYAIPLRLLEDKMEPQSGVLPSPSPVFEECQNAVNASIKEYVALYPQLARLLTAPTYALILGSAFCSFILYRICRDLVLSFKFVVGLVSGFLLQQHANSHKYAPQSSQLSKKEAKKARKAALKAKKEAKVIQRRRKLLTEGHNYTPQSGSLDNIKTYSRIFTQLASVTSAILALVTTLMRDEKRIALIPNGQYNPQSGLESDDGAKFLGKTTPKFGSSPDKPATTGAPGVSSVSNTGRHMQVLPRVAQPKQISKKDPNDGFLSGFGVGI